MHHANLDDETSGILYVMEDFHFKHPQTPEEDLQLQEDIIESFYDNPRYELLCIDKEMTRMYIEWSRAWDWKNGNRVGCYHTPTGKFAGACRYKRGDPSELSPYPDALLNHPGWKILMAITREGERRSKELHPKIFRDESKILRT